MEKSIGVMDNESGDDEAEELRHSIEKSEKKNDQDSVDGMMLEYLCVCVCVCVCVTALNWPTVSV